ncbi:MAG: NUDIX hydrolase [Turneriella sp.]
MESLLRHALLERLQTYPHFFVEEKAAVPRFLRLLQSADAYQRLHLPGHITGSAWIVDPGRTQTLLVHHAKLNIWVQPGGHADGDEDILSVALREAREETGLNALSVVPDFFDIDIHTIPARPDIGQHDHYDVRFLFEADPAQRIVVSEESHDAKWIALGKLEDCTREHSVLRMRDKLQRLALR